MKTYSQDEINEVFRRLGLATESERQRFRFEHLRSEEPKREDVQVFIRIVTDTKPPSWHSGDRGVGEV